MIDATRLDPKASKTKPVMNASTCSFSLTASGPASIISGSGTGAYKGLTGKLVVTINFAGYGPVKSGKCESQSGEPTSSYSAITGVGIVNHGLSVRQPRSRPLYNRV